MLGLRPNRTDRRITRTSIKSGKTFNDGGEGDTILFRRGVKGNGGGFSTNYRGVIYLISIKRRRERKIKGGQKTPNLRKIWGK